MKNFNEIKKAMDAVITLLMIVEENTVKEKFDALEKVLTSESTIEEKMYFKELFTSLLSKRLDLCNKYIYKAEELSITI